MTDQCPPTPNAPNCSITPTPTITSTPFARRIFVNEFLPEPISDWNHDGVADPNDEFVELYNRSANPIDLSGWKIDDGDGGSSPYVIPNGTTIGPNEFLNFFGSETHVGLNNEADSVRLLHPDNSVADEYAYTAAVANQAYGRYPDGTEDWETSCIPTPGRANCTVHAQPAPMPSGEA